MLTGPQGWMALIALEWVEDGIWDIGAGTTSGQHIGLGDHAPAHLAQLHIAGGSGSLTTPEASGSYPSDLRVDGQPASTVAIDGLIALKSDADGGSPTKLTVNSLTIALIKRGGRHALRVWDSQSAVIVDFHGLRWQSPDIRYRVQASWIPYPPGKTVSLPTVVDTVDVFTVPGAAEFTIDGQVLRLEAYLDDPGELFFVFWDPTSKTTSYGAGRFLSTPLPDHGVDQPGHVTLDFNRARSPPCAYTPFATCPLPAAVNRLSVPIPVGERRYSDDH